jgi:hypothetical protein
MDSMRLATTTDSSRTSTPTELIPLSIGDVFDEAFDLYKRNFALFAGITAVVSVPVHIASQAVNTAMGLDKLAARFGENGDLSDPSSAISIMLGFMAISSVEMIVFTVVHVLQSGALAVAVSQRYLGRPVTLRSAYGAVWRRIGALLGTWLLVLAVGGAAAGGILFVVSLLAGLVAGAFSVAGSAGIVLGMVVVIVGILVGCLIAAAAFVSLGLFATQIVTIEGTAWGAAMERNRALVRGRAPRIALAVVLLWVLLVCFWGAIWGSLQLALEYLVFSLLRVPETVQNLTNASVGAVIWLLLEPFWLVSVTLLYYDQRVRREGFDLTVLERQVEAIGERSALK